eukprot:CAMPEP_0201883120 /NCGR_PEP_ID=MMETSP0902-20130614/15160_1 /ASSEMBLY_ACC=CAM_ASM_000551 /TAXON_ID=420261 /ORGANISM="Thalassiosira antarctica, Strain CCMP982" /LENGTH=375 /DNA_ID=CAMNT_0048411839 /DNA_START=48 /DNA_END=1175 /DNA_ORIENTATION=-
MGVPRWGVAAAALLMLSTLSTTAAFTAPSQHLSQPRVTALAAHKNEPTPSFENRSSETTPSNNPSPSRRTFLSKIAGTSSVIIFSGTAQSAFAEGEETSDPAESIVARAARVSQEVKEAETAQQGAEEERRRELAQKLRDDPRSIYDFTLPVNGKAREVAELLGQTFGEGDGGDGWTDGGENGTNAAEGRLGTRVKAILVVNMKQDDPIARKNIPELLELVTKFGKNGEFAVIVSPSDQGYYEPDTSSLLRLKLEQEYGYGSAPGAILTDKVNYLGTGALPFWRWIEGNCRTPAGLGKIQANFEKFLVDGRTGKPLRRYPRKYQPYDIADDIAAVIKGRTLPPAQNNFKEEWRNAAKESEADTYRFQKGLNYFDQ